MSIFKRIYKIDITKCLTQFIVTFSLLVMSCTLNGEWLIICVHILNQFGMIESININQNELENLSNRFYLNGFFRFWLFTMISGYGIYFIVGGLFHWYYYVMQRDTPEKWKCQPKTWLSRDLELHEIRTGCISLLITNTWSSLIASYICNGGYSTVYYDSGAYGYIWLVLQWPIIFIYQDYATYWMHRWLHTPYLYNKFHKSHHIYRQPTAFSAVAIHPIEISLVQIVLVVPLFTVPVYWVAFSSIGLYTYYHGLVTHSGINFKAQWWQPWQPDAIFHDNHHQFYHVNYGFNCFIWDKIHNTYRKPDRIYNEDLFYGGKLMKEANEEELENERKERETETVAIYEDNKNPFLTEVVRVIESKKNK